MKFADELLTEYRDAVVAIASPSVWRRARSYTAATQENAQWAGIAPSTHAAAAVYAYALLEGQDTTQAEVGDVFDRQPATIRKYYAIVLNDARNNRVESTG